MPWPVIILSLGLLSVSALWILTVRAVIRRAGAAAENGRAVLLDRRGGMARLLGIEGLYMAINRLVEEGHQGARAAKGQLGQIEAMLESLREAVLILDSENRIELANKAFRDLLNLPDSPTGRFINSIIQGADFYDYVAAVKGGGGTDRLTLEVVVGRQVLWFEITGSRLPGNSGERGSLSLFVLHDITRLKQLERVRTEFIANVSHELRTPVTIIKGFADTLVEDLEELSPEESRRFLLKVQANVARLHQMLEELLLLSRLESNPEAVTLERHSLGQIVTETAERFRARIESRVTSFQVQLTPEDDTVLIDPFRISQVLENLLENALRHARGCREIVVRTRVVAPNVICEVRDDGAGIPPKDLPHVFERFYRVDKGRSRESGGTGLGLSIVKHIVQQHGGEIEAESQPGQGTTIRFTIPFPHARAERAVMSFARERAGRPTVKGIHPPELE